MSVVGLNKVNSVQDALNLTPQILSPRQSSDRPYYPQILLPAIKSAAEQFAEKYNQYK
jgi:hypothetical protein